MLKAGRLNATGDRKQRRFRGLFVIAEVTLSLVLLVSAGLMVKSLYYLQQVDPGFNPRRAVTMKIFLPKGSYPNESERRAFVDNVSEKLKALPGVQSVAAAYNLPLAGHRVMVPFDIDGRDVLPSGQKPFAAYNLVSPDYFRTMDIALRQGRAFSEQDDQNAARVVIISETTARHYWPNENPLGKHLILNMSNSGPIKPEIIGIAADVKQSGLANDLGRQIYEPYRQRPVANINLVVRTAADPLPTVPSLLNTVRSVDGNLPVDVKNLEKILTDSISHPHLVMLLLGIFATLSLVLAAIGIFGVISYSVTQRTQELGIRIALGAQKRHIYKLVIKQGIGLTLVGILIGVPCAFALTRLMSGLIFGLSAVDPATYIGSLLLMVLVALLACYLPARRAIKVDPKIALLSE
jgi:putative ABC transport system permease protein